MLELDLPCSSNTHDSGSSELVNQSYDELLNMVKIPFYLEKFMLLGLMICFNSFLTLFTLVPLKIMVQSVRTLISFVKSVNSTNRFRTLVDSIRWIKRDVLTVSMVFLALVTLSYSTLDISRMYHDIRGQAHIKLYVMFGVLEVTDRLLSSMGQDILNILYKLPEIELIAAFVEFTIFYVLSIAYLAGHGYVLIYQTVSLNVAANSYSNALLTLLLSNQFAELKGSVFKKFEREGLFQVSIADLAERYQLTLMVGIIAIRNILQLNIDQFGLIPYSWNSWNRWVGAIFGPGIIIIGSEIFVDWLKHCFISRFNKFRPLVYQNYIHVLSLDYLQASKTSPSSSSEVHVLSDYIVLMRRLGVPLLASIVCFLGMTIGDFKHILIFPTTGSLTKAIVCTLLLISSVFLVLVLIRVLLGLFILKFATRIKQEYRVHKLYLKSRAKKIMEEKSSSEPALGTKYHSRGTFTVLSNSLAGEKSIPNDESSTDSSEAYAKAVIETQFLPGIPSPEVATINPNTREYIYDNGEEPRPNLEMTRNKRIIELTQSDTDPMHKVMRYEMSSKRIW